MSYEVVTKTLGDLYQESQQVSASPSVPVKPGPPAPATTPQRIDPMEEVIRNFENSRFMYLHYCVHVVYIQLYFMYSSLSLPLSLPSFLRSHFYLSFFVFVSFSPSLFSLIH